MSDSMDGMVEVRDGRIIVTGPEGGGREAAITAGSEIKLIVDGVEIKGRVLVTKDSSISVTLPDKEPERTFDIAIKDENTRASIKVFYRDGAKYILKDSPPSNQIYLQTEIQKVIQCVPYTIIEAKSLLRDKGIVYGVMEDKLLKAITEGKGEEVTVACGQPPVDGRDDKLEPKFSDSSRLVEVDGRIDFYSIGKIASVTAGALVAEKILGDDGIEGIDILGNKIKQRRGKRINMAAGKGATISDDGLKIYAKINGRPEIRGNVVSVHEVYEVLSDVGIKTGNIDFVGDVIVRGNISEGMKVKAGNNVTVLGNITGSEIAAGGNVIVQKNVIGSTIKAGHNDFMKKKLAEIMEDICGKLQGIISIIQILKETGKIPKIYTDGQIIKMVIETKYGDLPKLIDNLQHMLAGNRDFIDDDTLQVGALLIKYYGGKGPLLIENYMLLSEHIELIKSHIEVINERLRESSNITALYVQNSCLSTSGDITICGKGCFTSVLECGGDVDISTHESVTRGGSINAQGNVEIYELGSVGGALTHISVGKESVINCEIAHMNSVIRVGNMTTRIDNPVKKLKAYIYKGELMVEKSVL